MTIIEISKEIRAKMKTKVSTVVKRRNENELYDIKTVTIKRQNPVAYAHNTKIDIGSDLSATIFPGEQFQLEIILTPNFWPEGIPRAVGLDRKGVRALRKICDDWLANNEKAIKQRKLLRR
jgi:hypothetical protein